MGHEFGLETVPTTDDVGLVLIDEPPAEPTDAPQPAGKEA